VPTPSTEVLVERHNDAILGLSAREYLSILY